MNELPPPLLVLYRFGCLTGTMLKTDDSLSSLHTTYLARLVHTDEKGNEHWALLGRRSKRGEA